MPSIRTLADLQRTWQNAWGGARSTDAEPNIGQYSFESWLNPQLEAGGGTWKDLGNGTYELPDIPKESGLDAFMNSPGLPLTMFGGLMAGTGGLSQLLGGSGGMTGTTETYAAPNTFIGAGSDASFMGAGVDPVVGADAAAGTSLWDTSGLTGAASAGAGTQAASAKTALGSLSQILQNGGTVDDWLKVAGTAAPGLIAAYASGQQGDAIKDIAGQQQAQFDKYFQMGQPYRDRLAGLYADPSKFLSSQEVQAPVQQGTDALARSLSAKVGNPIDNMTALGELQNYSANQLFGRLGQEKDRLAGFGGLSAYNQAGASGNTLQAQLMGANADAGIWGGLGRAAGDVFNSASTLGEILKQMQGSNIFTVKG